MTKPKKTSPGAIVEAPPTRPRGRPSTRTQAIDDEIIERLSCGETLRSICRDAHMPAWQTVYLWKRTDEDFAERFARARDDGHDAIAEQALEIADTPVTGERVEEDDKGVKVVREDMLGHRKLQVETRLKLLAKWNPTKYGDRQQVDMTTKKAVTDLTEDELLAELAALKAAGVPVQGSDGD